MTTQHKTIMEVRTGNPTLDDSELLDIIYERGTSGTWNIAERVFRHLTTIKISNWGSTTYILADIDKENTVRLTRTINNRERNYYVISFYNKEYVDGSLIFNGQCSRTYHYE